MKAQTKKTRQNKRNNASKLITNIKLYGGICNRVKTMATTTRESKTFENVIINAVNTGAAYGGSARRLELVLKDTKIPAFDKEGKETEADRFSVDYTKINDALAESNIMFKLILAKSMGRIIKAEIYGLMLQDAEISFTRTLYQKGEKRNERAFEKNTWVCDVDKITLHTPELFQNEISRMIQCNDLYETVKTSNVNVNFFNV